MGTKVKKMGGQYFLVLETYKTVFVTRKTKHLMHKIKENSPLCPLAVEISRLLETRGTQCADIWLE